MWNLIIKYIKNDYLENVLWFHRNKTDLRMVKRLKTNLCILFFKTFIYLVKQNKKKNYLKKGKRGQNYHRNVYECIWTKIFTQ